MSLQRLACSEQPQTVVVACRLRSASPTAVHAVYADLADRSLGMRVAARCGSPVSGRSVDWMPSNGVGIAGRLGRMGVESIKTSTMGQASALQRRKMHCTGAFWCPSLISELLPLGNNSGGGVNADGGGWTYQVRYPP